MAFGNNYSYNPYVNPYASPYNAPQVQFNQPAQFNAQPQQPPQNANNGFVWVNNIDEANAYMVAPNNAVQLWDKNSPCVYLKTADAAGKPTMQIFDLVERKTAQTATQEPTEGNDYVLRSEFEELKEIVSTLTAKKPKAKVKGVVEDA